MTFPHNAEDLDPVLNRNREARIALGRTVLEKSGCPLPEDGALDDEARFSLFEMFSNMSFRFAHDAQQTEGAARDTLLRRAFLSHCAVEAVMSQGRLSRQLLEDMVADLEDDDDAAGDDLLAAAALAEVDDATSNEALAA